MSDYRDTRGGAYDPVNDFGNPQPPKCGINRQHTRKHNGVRRETRAVAKPAPRVPAA